MTLSQLRYLAAIVDADLNLTGAARRLHATPSGLSKQIRLLEQELGFVLFTRRARSFTSLTTAGEQVLAHARELLSHANSIHTLGANLRKEMHGELRIATTHTQARHVLPPKVANLRRKFPDVAVHLSPGGNAASLRQLARGEVDMAIISSVGRFPGVAVALPLYRWNRVIVLPETHRLASLARPVTLSDLAHESIVSYESSRDPRSSLRTAFAEAGIEPNISLTAPDADLIVTYVRSGHGVGILAEMAARTEPEGLKILRADDLFPACTTWLLLRQELVLREYAFAFIGELMPQLHLTELRRALSNTRDAVADVEVPDWRE